MNLRPVHRGPPAKNRRLSAWELPRLLVPMHQHKAKPAKRARRKKEPAYLAALLTFVYRNRYVISSQVHRRFAKTLRSDRTTRRHLAELEQQGHLMVVPTRCGSPLWPKVYAIAPKGEARLRRQQASQDGAITVHAERRRKAGFGVDHVLHELLITEFLLELWELAQAGHFELLRVERRSLASQSWLEVIDRGKRSRLRPDGMFVHREPGRGIMCSFVELDTGSMSKEQMRRKFDRYAAWAKSERGQKFLISLYQRLGATAPRPVFRILTVVCGRANEDDRRRIIELGAIARQHSWIAKRSWFTSVAQFSEEAASKAIVAGTWNSAGGLRNRLFGG